MDAWKAPPAQGLTRGCELAFLARSVAHFWTRFWIENRPMEKPRTGDDTGPLRFHGGTSDGREVTVTGRYVWS